MPASKSAFFLHTGDLSKEHLHFCGAGLSAHNHYAKTLSSFPTETAALGDEMSLMVLCLTMALSKLGEAPLGGEKGSWLLQ